MVETTHTRHLVGVTSTISVVPVSSSTTWTCPETSTINDNIRDTIIAWTRLPFSSLVDYCTFTKTSDLINPEETKGVTLLMYDSVDSDVYLCLPGLCDSLSLVNGGPKGTTRIRTSLESSLSSTIALRFPDILSTQCYINLIVLINE